MTVNLFEVELQEDEDEPPGYGARYARIGSLVGSEQLVLSVYELAPGLSICPYHYENAEEEWLIVIDGELTLRTPEGESILRAGDVTCFPAGAAGGHAVRNHSDAPVRYAMPSAEARYGGATVYPDSGKIRVAGPGFDHRGWLGEPVEYWEGEQ